MSAARQRVSLCMIVRDEEANLAECLAPIAHLFDEIIIVDTGSRDRTLEIARRFTPHVYHYEWTDDFSAARNESLRHATGDWIFWLDADDRIQPQQIPALRNLLQSLDDQPQVFVLNTVMLPAAANEDPLYASHLRLFRRHENVLWHGRVHEQLVPDLTQLGYQRVATNIEIEHIGYQNNTVAERKLRRKLRLLRMDYAVNPNDPSTLLHLGMSLCRWQHYDDARRCFLRLLDMNLGAAACLRWVYDALIDLAHIAGNLIAAARYAELGLRLCPDDEYLLLAQAKTLYLQKDYASAIRVLHRAIDTPQSRQMLFAAPGNVKTRLAPLLLGAAYRMQQCYAAAEETLQGVIASFPDDSEAWYYLGLVYLDQGLRPELVGTIERLRTTPGGTTNARLLVAMTHLRHGDLNVAAQHLDDILAADSANARARMLRAEWVSRSRASFQDQLRALKDVLRFDPGNVEALNWIQKTKQAQQSAPAAAAPVDSSAMFAAPAVGIN